MATNQNNIRKGLRRQTIFFHVRISLNFQKISLKKVQNCLHFCKIDCVIYGRLFALNI